MTTARMVADKVLSLGIVALVLCSVLVFDCVRWSMGWAKGRDNWNDAKNAALELLE